MADEHIVSDADRAATEELPPLVFPVEAVE